MRAEVYRNLHTGTWSVRMLENLPGHPRKGRVTDHPDTVFMRDAKFVVQPAGQAKVRAEGRKNVHAFVRGEVQWLASGGEHPPSDDRYRRATYNPYKHDTFVDAETGEPILTAGRVLLDIQTGLWYAEPNEGA